MAGGGSGHRPPQPTAKPAASPALRDLGLVGRVLGVPPRVLQQVAQDDGRDVGAVVAHAEVRLGHLAGEIDWTKRGGREWLAGEGAIGGGGRSRRAAGCAPRAATLVGLSTSFPSRRAASCRLELACRHGRSLARRLPGPHPAPWRAQLAKHNAAGRAPHARQTKRHPPPPPPGTHPRVPCCATPGARRTLFLPAISLNMERNSLSVSPSWYLPSGMPSLRLMASGTVASILASRLSKPQKRAISCCSATLMLLWRGSKLRGGGGGWGEGGR